MPVPLGPITVFALRTGVVAAAIWAIREGFSQGRTDQRAEEALDETDEGVALHRPQDRAVEGTSQTNAAARFRRTLRWGNSGVEVDAAMLARVRIRKL